MIYKGRVQGGVIVLDPPGELPEGTIVEVSLLDEAEAMEPLDPLYTVGELAVDMGMSDLASNIDYYLYGHPKVALAPYELAIGSETTPGGELSPLGRARLSLEGLSIGDSFGDRFFILQDEAEAAIRERVDPKPPWPYTDDTLMALSVYESLRAVGGIDPDRLARSFADRYDGSRGYGPAMHRLLARIRDGGDWPAASRGQFGGQGSHGNGSAMRVAPIGGYFADDLDAVVEHARRSAVVTHAHPEAVAGAVAVAIGAAHAWRLREADESPSVREFLELILPHVPDSVVREKIYHAMALDPDASVRLGVAALGNGVEMSSQDTVPFALWCAGKHLGHFEDALWWTVEGLGDRDTTCAIVGGIVALHVGEVGLPRWWRGFRETLPVWPFQDAD